MYVKIQLVREGAILPRYQTPLASGMDIHASISSPMTISPGGLIAVPTGFMVAVPRGYEMQIRPRSGMGRKGIIIPNAPGTVDADFRGEVMVLLKNLTGQPFLIEPNDRIAQCMIAPVQRFAWYPSDDLGETERGDGGFGSTGT